jgi:hypothetical protein
MGQWGKESYSGDGCWDCLSYGIGDIHAFSQAEANACLKHNYKNIKGKKNIDSCDKQEFLGVVIWILRHGRAVVVKQHLKTALAFARELLSDEEYLLDWKEPKIRKIHLKNEIEQCQRALKCDGTIPDGMPVMEDKPEEETPSETVVAAACLRNGLIYSVPRPGRHGDIIRLMCDNGCEAPIIRSKQGFISSDGRFLTRREAFVLACRSGQLQEDEKKDAILVSEDLW